MGNRELAEAVRAAANVTCAMAFLTNEHSVRTGRAIGMDGELPIKLVNAFDEELKNLEQLLMRPDIESRLSLANPYPVEVAGIPSDSYTSAVATVGRQIINVLLQSREPLPVDFAPIDYAVAIQCQKEYERATGESVPDIDTPSAIVETIEQIQPRYRPPACKKCGGKSKVTSTQGRTRFLKCTNEECGHSFKSTLQQPAVI